MTSIRKTNNSEEVSTIDDKSTDVRNIAFDPIDDDYSWSMYGKFKIMMMNKNGYMNASKFCQTGRKQLKHWNEAKFAKELEREMCKELNLSIAELKIKIMKGKFVTRGTYVHPLLITSIATWLYPLFQFNTSLWIEEWKDYSVKNNSKYLFG